MKTNPVGWFEIYADELDRARKFYEAVLGIELTPMGPVSDDLQMLGFPMESGAPGAGGALCKMRGFKAGGNSVLVYFMSDDCGIQEKRVSGAGGKIHKTKTSIGEHGFIMLGFDTEGNMFGVHSMK